VATFHAVVDAVTDGAVEWGMLPVWNSTIGRVTAAREVLDARAGQVVREGEVDVPVHHCLLGLPGTPIESVRHVGSHPAALAQCTRLFRLNARMKAVEAFDTAGAAAQLASFDRARAMGEEFWYDVLASASPTTLAVIASARAATAYGLTVLQRGVNDEPTNFTRFVVLRAREVPA
jgi:prephenate dehydratase